MTRLSDTTLSSIALSVFVRIYSQSLPAIFFCFILRKAKADQIPSISSNSKQRNLSPQVSKAVRDFGRGFVEQTRLNLVEGFFSKLTRQSLKGIRVKTKEELVERIYKYFEEINESPVVYHWKYRLDEIDPSEELHVETLPLKKSS